MDMSELKALEAPPVTLEMMKKIAAAELNKAAAQISFSMTNDLQLWTMIPEPALPKSDWAKESAQILEIAALLEQEFAPDGLSFTQIGGRLLATHGDKWDIDPGNTHPVCAMGKALMLKGVSPREMWSPDGSIIRDTFPHLSPRMVQNLYTWNDRDHMSFGQIAQRLRLWAR